MIIKQKNDTLFSKKGLKPSIASAILRKGGFILSIVIVFILLLTIFESYRSFSESTSKIRERYIDQQKRIFKDQVEILTSYIGFVKSNIETVFKADIKSKVDAAINLADSIYKQDITGCDDSCKLDLIREALRNVRFNDGKGYFFIFKADGEIILLANNPTLEGQNTFTSPAFASLDMRSMIGSTVEEGETYFVYNWTKPGAAGKNHLKVSFGKYYAPLDMMIGTGAYEEDYIGLAQSQVIDYMQKTKFGNGSYFFAASYDGYGVAGPSVGQHVYDLQDANGIYVVRELIHIAEHGGGFLEYWVPKETGLRASPKISYVEPIDDWNWYVGTGEYVDNIEQIISAEEKDLFENLILQIIFIFSLAIGVMLGGLFFLNNSFKKIREDFSKFFSFFNNAVNDSARINVEKLNFIELEDLGKQANKMISLRKKAESLAMKRAKDLEKANKKTKEQIDLKNKFVNQIAHDLKAPLTPIMILTPLLRKKIASVKGVDKKTIERMDIITNNSRYLKELIDKTLDIARLDAGLLDMDLQPVNLCQIIDDQIRDNRPLLEEEKINISFKRDKTFCYVSADSLRIRELLQNLLSNSVKYSRPNKPLRIKISVTKFNSKKVLVSFSDNGKGVKEDIIKNIFDEFFKEADKTKESSAGLGLSICKRIIKGHHGKIWAEKSDSGGLTIKFTLQIAKNIS